MLFAPFLASPCPPPPPQEQRGADGLEERGPAAGHGARGLPALGALHRGSAEQCVAAEGRAPELPGEVPPQGRGQGVAGHMGRGRGKLEDAGIRGEKQALRG